MGTIAAVQTAEDVTDEDGSIGVDVQVDPGGGALVTAEHYADSGDDSKPLPDDFAALTDAPGCGAQKVSGYSDPKTAKKAKPGGKRIYSRSAPGQVSAEVWLQPDGTVRIEIFSAKSLTIKSDGPVIVDSPDVRVGSGAGQAIARVGDLVAVRVPLLVCAAPGSPAVPIPPTAVSPDGSYVATGVIISGATSSKA